MPSILDAFFIEIGLDPTKYQKGAKDLTEADKRVRELMLSTGKQIEESGKKSGESIGFLKNNVLGLFAAFTGVGVTAFVSQMIHADAATGRAAKTLNMSSKDLGAWESAAQLAGAKVGELTSGLGTFTQALETARLTGDASFGAKFRQLFNIDVMGPNGLKTAAELYLEIARKAEGMDPAKATTAMSILGVPAGVIPLLLQGEAKVKSLVEEMSKLQGFGDAGAAAAVRFENAWTRAFKAIQGAARPLYDIGTKIADVITFAATPENSDFIKKLAEKNSEVSKLFWMRGSKGTSSYAAWEKANTELEALEAENARLHDKAAVKGSEEARSQVGLGGAFTSQAEKEAVKGSEEARSQVGLGGAFTSQAEKEAFIRAEAAKRGIDPDIAMKVAKSEGFNKYRGDLDATGRPTSFGSFQLHYPGIGRHTADGLGTTFTKQTGLDARDPATEREQIKFALDQASRKGWGDWHGFRGARFAGIKPGGAGVAANNFRNDNSNRSTQSSSSTTDVHIGAINVYPPNGDADSISKSIGPAIKRDLFTQQANDGPQ